MKAGRIYPESKQSLKTLLETDNTKPFAMGVGGRREREGATVLQDQFIVLQLHCAGSGVARGGRGGVTTRGESPETALNA